jgi:hypothetical protein
MNDHLTWVEHSSYYEATVGNFDEGDGVRFTLQCLPTCYRRGPWKLLIEIASGPMHHKWGCFDADDQPMRYYHVKESAYTEAQEIARVLVADRLSREVQHG